MVGDPRERFTESAAWYARYRPSYPSALVDWLVEKTGVVAPAEVADVGCGTGISTRLFAERGFHVTGIEPNRAMRAHAGWIPGARIVPGEAAATGLTDRSVDLVVAAQAFHWFDLGPTLREWQRILKPGRWCAAFWNKKEKSPLRDDFEAIRRKWSDDPEGERAERERRSKKKVIAAIRKSPGLDAVEEATFEQTHALDRESFFGRVLTGSYFSHDKAQLASFREDFEAFFDRHQRNGTLELRLRARAIAWRFA